MDFFISSVYSLLNISMQHRPWSEPVFLHQKMEGFSLKHYVLLKLKPGTDLEAAYRKVSDTYQKLDETLPFLHNPQVYRNCVERDSNFDIMASIELGNEEELHAYLTHPLHMQMAADMKDVLCGRTSFDHE